MFSLNKIIPLDSDYKFLNFRKHFYVVSFIALVFSLTLLLFKGLNLGIDQFGESAPYKEVYDHFNLTEEKITNFIQKKLRE